MFRNIIIGVVGLIGIGALVAFFIAQNGQKPEEKEEIQPIGEQVEYNIVGIEPGAGVMINTEKAVEEYGLGEVGWSLQESSSAAMMAAFQDAVANEQPIVVTLWEPHALFSIADVRKLNDPKSIYNNPQKTSEFLRQNAPDWAEAQVASDVIGTVVYKGFADDAPAAYEFFRNFSIEASTQSNWIFELAIQEREPEDIAKEYIEQNRELADSWKPEDAELGKEKIVIGIPPWPGVTVKSRVVKKLLEEMGYTVEIKEVDVGIVYTGLADKQIDATLAGWLPNTHAEYWEEKSGQLEIAGVNITNTWLGLAVPNYVHESIQSIEDLVK
jgi:glycine betaine/proline transport system substrate-binding protein